jgi:dTMP kinase
MAGIFISFEGIDGAGKSSHIESLAAQFRQRGLALTVTREPGGTPLAEKLRDIVLHDQMDSLSEALLIFAARRDHIAKVIVPALARGDVVLCDRFTDASFAYQGGGRGFDLTVLVTLEQWVQAGGRPGEHESGAAGLLQPDLTFWFDIAPEIAAQRLQQARAPDKFEAQPLAFFQRVVAGYEARRRDAPQRFVRIDAAPAPAEVSRQVLDAIRARGWLS